MAGRIKLLVNAVPLMNIGTGIGRYLKCLYTEMETQYSDSLEIRYFDGVKVLSVMPSGPGNLTMWLRAIDLFWKLPAYLAFLFRLGLHYKMEIVFYRIAKDFDIYHEAGFFPFKVPSNVKIIFTLHDLSVMCFPKHHPLDRVLYCRMFLRARCKKADHFLAVSRFTKGEMESLLDIGSEKITVTHLAHDPAVFYQKDQRAVRRFQEKRGLPERYFLFVGSGDPRKNMDIIPEAIKRAGLNEPLVVAGWSGWSDNVSWKNVISLGYISDDELACLYSGALALVFPSSYEGFGLPLLEAMACGCPVVTTNEASLPEVAENAALYMKSPRDIESLAGILQALASKPKLYQEMKEKGLRRAAEFSWSHTAHGVRNALLMLLKK